MELILPIERSGDGGDGYGDGGGYGYGGYGYGYGDGDGYGGDGDGGDGGYGGDGGDELAPFLAHSLAIESPSGAVVCLWKSDINGRPANGGAGNPVSVGIIEKVDGPLNLCEPGTLHGTFSPKKWKGERMWLVAMHSPYVIEGDKVGSLKREILAEVPFCI